MGRSKKGNNVDNDRGFDEIESALLKEEMHFSSSKSSMLLHSTQLDQKLNLTVRVQNDITRSEKKGERRANYHGRDDRATSEQVLDPRTRLILFKLLSNGFLEEIDGKKLFPHYPLSVMLRLSYPQDVSALERKPMFTTPMAMVVNML